MDYTAYAEFCRAIGYKVEQTSHGIWIGPSRGFFNRVPLYETMTPTEDELRTLFRRYPTIGVNYAAEPGTQGRVGHNYFVRDPNYDMKALNSKGRWSVRKGLKHCQVRPISFDELHLLGMPLNLDTLTRHGRDEPIFSDPDRWARLCRAGAGTEGAQVWGAFVGDELGTYIVLIRIGNVVNLLYSNSRTDLMNLHPSSALFFIVIQTMMQTPGVEAVFNGAQWITTTRGLDRFKQRLGFEVEPVVFVVKLRPLAKRILLDWGGRRAIAASGRWLSDRDVYQQIQTVLDMAALPLESP